MLAALGREGGRGGCSVGSREYLGFGGRESRGNSEKFRDGKGGFMGVLGGKGKRRRGKGEDGHCHAHSILVAPQPLKPVLSPALPSLPLRCRRLQSGRIISKVLSQVRFGELVVPPASRIVLETMKV